LSDSNNIVIIGGGIAGICAALSAAEAGSSVTIIEKSNNLGGNATRSNVGTICGSYLRSENNDIKIVGNTFTQSLIFELLKHFKIDFPINYQNGLYIVPYDWEQLNDFLKVKIDSNESIKVLYNTEVSELKTQGKIILKLTTTNDTEIDIDSIIDCSGKAVISNLLHHPLIKSENYQSAAQIFRVGNINSNDEFIINMSIKKMVLASTKQYNFPKSYQSISVVPGSIRNGVLDIKLPLPDLITDETNIKQLSKNAEKAVKFIFDEMVKQINSFKNAQLETIFPDVGVRVLNRFEGKEILTEEDILNTKKYQTGIAIGSWPIEYWNTNGKLELTTFKTDDYYLIPANCLISNIFDNLFFAGKNISATDNAIASARVIGTCIQTGYASGKLAINKNRIEETVLSLRNELMIANECI